MIIWRVGLCIREMIYSREEMVHMLASPMSPVELGMSDSS